MSWQIMYIYVIHLWFFEVCMLHGANSSPFVVRRPTSYSSNLPGYAPLLTTVTMLDGRSLEHSNGNFISFNHYLFLTPPVSALSRQHSTLRSWVCFFRLQRESSSIMAKLRSVGLAGPVTDTEEHTGWSQHPDCCGQYYNKHGAYFKVEGRNRLLVSSDLHSGMCARSHTIIKLKQLDPVQNWSPDLRSFFFLSIAITHMSPINSLVCWHLLMGGAEKLMRLHGNFRRFPTDVTQKKK